MKHPRAIDLMPAIARKRFTPKPKRRLGLWGTLIVSNLAWIGLAGLLVSGLWSSAKWGSTMTEFYLAERAKWAAQNEKKQKELEARNMEIARLVAFQTSQSPEDVVQLANSISKVLTGSTGSRRVFLEESIPHAIRIQVQYGIPASATISMAILESGYGRSDLARNHKNFFGIKAFRNWSGPRVNMPTVDSGVRTRAYFRAYGSLGEGFQGFADFLRETGRYSNAFYKETGEEFVHAVLRAGYCPDHDYIDKIRNIMTSHNLTELDTILKAAPDAPYQVSWGTKPEEDKHTKPQTVPAG